MEEIVSAKVEQIPEVKAKLQTAVPPSLKEQSTCSGALDWMSMPLCTLTIKSGPAKTNLKIYQRLASKLNRKLRSSSLPWRGATNEGQSNIEDSLKDLKKDRKKNNKSDAG